MKLNKKNAALRESFLAEAYEASAKGLREFGYPDASAAMIKTAHEKWVKGDKPTGVIEMFAVRDFGQYPDLFGKKGEPT